MDDRNTISIVNFNQCKLLDRCLCRLHELGYSSVFRVIVVDNNSRDHSVSMVRDKYQWVELLPSLINLGYGGGHNLAYSTTQSSYFIVLNADIYVMPGSMEALINLFGVNSKFAVAGPCLLNPDGSLQYSARRNYNWLTVLGRRIPLLGSERMNRHHLMMDCDMSKTQPVDWIMGAALAIRREAFPTSLFDTRYRLYFEDVDLCYFARKRGWEIVYCPASRMIHDHQRASAKSGFSRLKWIHIESWFKFCVKKWLCQIRLTRA